MADNMGLSSIAEHQKVKFLQQIGMTWYFEHFYEKFIMVLLMALGLWKVVDLVRWLF